MVKKKIIENNMNTKLASFIKYQVYYFKELKVVEFGKEKSNPVARSHRIKRMTNCLLIHLTVKECFNEYIVYTYIKNKIFIKMIHLLVK